MTPTGGRFRPRLAAAIITLAAAVTCARAGPDDLFRDGNEAYKNGRYDEAVASYEKILSYGLDDPRLYYNLGNACFKQGRLGAAILNYERALRLAPADREARDNLTRARGQIRDRVVEPELQYPIRVLRDSLDALSPDLLAWALLLVDAFASALIGALLLSSSWLRRRLFGYAALGAGMVALALGAALLYRVQTASLPSAIVMQDKVDVRSGPGDDNTILFTVHEGTRMELHNRLDPWVQVSLPNGLSGWVPAASVEKV